MLLTLYQGSYFFVKPFIDSQKKLPTNHNGKPTKIAKPKPTKTKNARKQAKIINREIIFDLSFTLGWRKEYSNQPREHLNKTWLG